MSNKRSYLDTLNAGRQRRPGTTFDELDRSLESLEEQFRSSPFGSEEPRAFGSSPQNPRREYRDAHGAPIAREQNVHGGNPSSADPDRPAISHGERPAFASWGEEIERARAREEAASAAGRIAAELRSLRAELRHQESRQQDLSAGLQREIAQLRHDLGRSGAGDPSVEIERLSQALVDMADRGDTQGIAALRGEMSEMRGSIEQFARGNGLGGLEQLWEMLERRLEGFERKLADGSASGALQARLEALDDAVRQLPTAGSFRDVEEHVRTLASAVDQLARHRDLVQPAELAAIEARLDEISRAIVASAVAAQPTGLDPEPFERLDARLDALSRQVEEAGGGHDDEIMGRLAQLQARVDELADRAALPEKAVAQLSQQVSIIAAKLDEAGALPDPDFLFKGIEQRFETLAAMLDQHRGETSERSNILFRDLERRLDEVADRVDEATAHRAQRDEALIGVIDTRLEEFARRLEVRAPQGGEGRLIRSLEAQIAVLTEHLARPGATRGDLEIIAPRLENIERSIQDNRNAVIEAARDAAENAVKSLGTQGMDAESAAGLAQDLKSLEALTKRSDERNARTFEAIHDTLVKIVDRIDAIDRSAPASQAPMRQAIEDAPSLDAGEPIERPTPAQAKGNPVVSPAEAAQAAAVAALEEPEPAAAVAAGGNRVRAMLGSLGRKLGSRKEGRAAPTAEPTLARLEETGDAKEAAPSIDLDEPLDPRALDKPIEPNTGGPDLNAIMRRVRDERAASGRPQSADVAKSDFIAAARRAAQAAAAEAEVLKRGAESDKAGPKLRLSQVFGRHRKSVLMGVSALVIALMGLQLGVAAFDPADEAREAPAAAKAPQTGAKAQAAVAKPGKLDAVPKEASAAASEVKSLTAPALQAKAAAEKNLALPAAPHAAAAPVASVADEAPQAAAAAQAEAPETAMAEPEAEAMAPNAAAPLPATAPSVPNGIEPQALREAAAAGDAKALFELGARYSEGRGVTADMIAAAQWLEASAGLGFAPAQYRLGSLYEKGRGVPRDVAKARTLYQQAAEAGNAAAMHNLAVLHAMGADGATDNEEAARWFAAAAELGVKDSQFNLGILAAKGVGMERNLEESYKWFSLVAVSGDADAAAKREEIAGSLAPEQLERARAAAELWKPKPLDPEANTVEIPDSWQAGPATTASVDMKAAVKTIQLILNKNGYAAGGADGVMGEKTKSAIKAFQKDNALLPTGEVDDRLVQALLTRK
ncbi:MAG TPA: peptidoglycan-binding protein [Mesorhizobium sp.]|jgi:localization factor PodJL|nr:peptidoglycan-binding protein [Mesorhizobium sp.]